MHARILLLVRRATALPNRCSPVAKSGSANRQVSPGSGPHSQLFLLLWAAYAFLLMCVRACVFLFFFFLSDDRDGAYQKCIAVFPLRSDRGPRVLRRLSPLASSDRPRSRPSGRHKCRPCCFAVRRWLPLFSFPPPTPLPPWNFCVRLFFFCGSELPLVSQGPICCSLDSEKGGRVRDPPRHVIAVCCTPAPLQPNWRERKKIERAPSNPHGWAFSSLGD